jgi:tetratricopeptide (TPR) repeat protein
MRGHKRARSGCCCAAALGLWLLASAAAAQDESTLAAARQLGQQGVALYEQGDYIGASQKLERAFAAVKVPTLGLWSGRALEKLGKLVEASQRYREVTLIALRVTDSQVLRNAQADAQKAYDALASRIPQLTVELDGASADEASVTIAGKAVPSALIGAAVPVNPGTLDVEAHRGGDVAKEQVVLREGEQRTIKLHFEQAAGPAHAPSAAEAAASVAPAAAPASQPEDDAAASGHHSSIVPWVIVGAGGALVVTGGVFVALALSAKSNVTNVADGTKWSAVSGDYDHVPTYSTLGFVLLGAGAAAITTGLVLKFTHRDSEETAVSVTATPTGVLMRGVL